MRYEGDVSWFLLGLKLWDVIISYHGKFVNFLVYFWRNRVAFLVNSLVAFLKTYYWKWHFQFQPVSFSKTPHRSFNGESHLKWENHMMHCSKMLNFVSDIDCLKLISYSPCLHWSKVEGMIANSEVPWKKSNMLTYFLVQKGRKKIRLESKCQTAWYKQNWTVNYFG